MRDDQAMRQLAVIEARVLSHVREREQARRGLLRRVAELQLFSRTFAPCLIGGIVEAVDLERLGILALAVADTAENELDAMVAEVEARS